MRKVTPQIRLIAFTQNEDGTRSVMDIIETDFHYAYQFARRWIKDVDVVAIGTVYISAVGVPLSNITTIRDIR